MIAAVVAVEMEAVVVTWVGMMVWKQPQVCPEKTEETDGMTCGQQARLLW